jgi:hypothetical protein
MKQKIKGKHCAVFCFAGKRFFLNIYDVITWKQNRKRSSYYYLGRRAQHGLRITTTERLRGRQRQFQEDMCYERRFGRAGLAFSAGPASESETQFSPARTKISACPGITAVVINF